MKDITLKAQPEGLRLVWPVYDLRMLSDGPTTFCERHQDGSITNCVINKEPVSPEQYEAFMKEISGF